METTPNINTQATANIPALRRKKMAEHFIQGAIKHPGAFRKEAEEAGKSTAEFAKEKEHAPGKVGQRARLAETLMHLHKAKRKSAPHHPGPLHPMTHSMMAQSGETMPHSALAHLRKAKASRRA